MEEAPIVKPSVDNKPLEISLNSENLYLVKNSDNLNYKLKIKLNINGKEHNFFANID